MDILIIIKSILFLEGLLLYQVSPRLLFDAFLKEGKYWEYTLGYISAFIWVCIADRTRRIHYTLIFCMILATGLKIFRDSVPYYADFFYIWRAAMIIPLTCAFTMMQLSPIQERYRWGLQYVWLILGRFVRTCFLEKLLTNYETPFDVFLTIIFIILVASIPWIQEQNLRLIDGKKPVQIYSPITKLLGQVRYLIFLLSVLSASFFFFYSKKLVDFPPVDPAIGFVTEIATCILSYFLSPHRIAPQAFFLIGQFIISLRCIIFLLGCPKSFAIPLEIISATGFIVTTVANAQIIATHARPGLEYTTCALVDIFKSGLAPVIFVHLIPFFSFKQPFITCFIFISAFCIKYFFIDYPHDNLIKKKLVS